ncbi:PIN domain-containing protein [Leptolyngbya sp. FACHB-17]|uniref:type II toxin-antitoxin system VapC family toxin n=1 Tax=unclassified Leptolyngbya TaxID=2650499 RepID=UPI001680F4C5|nr:PIN domain-containing protein [Leptolyngbya sp. FACHB-17]MBD2079797.1 type II toxin-antitoxin system VapC family toxin [Leptolyngbya sp. FACHB-17]
MPEIILLDTHLWFWFINKDLTRFPSHWNTVIENATQVGVSPVSCYEIALAHQRGRLALPCSADQWLQEALEPSGIDLFPLTADIAYRAVSLSPIHRDPFDRLIIGTALVYKATLLSIDSVFPQYPELAPYLLRSQP